MGRGKPNSTAATVEPPKSVKGKPAGDSALHLPADVKPLARQMLVDGSTFEDIVEAIKERKGEVISLHAVESYFRSNLGIQKERIARQLQTAKVLKEALTDPKSGHAELAEAVLITGLMGVNRRSASSSLQQAIRVKEQQANQSLKEEAFRLRLEKFAMDKKVLTARLRAEETKQELVRTKLSHLKQALERSGEDKMLGPEIIRQIHDIYGLVSAPNSGASNGEGLHGDT